MARALHSLPYSSIDVQPLVEPLRCQPHLTAFVSKFSPLLMEEGFVNLLSCVCGCGRGDIKVTNTGRSKMSFQIRDGDGVSFGGLAIGAAANEIAEWGHISVCVSARHLHGLPRFPLTRLQHRGAISFVGKYLASDLRRAQVPIEWCHGRCDLDTRDTSCWSCSSKVCSRYMRTGRWVHCQGVWCIWDLMLCFDLYVFWGLLLKTATSRFGFSCCWNCRPWVLQVRRQSRYSIYLQLSCAEGSVEFNEVIASLRSQGAVHVLQDHEFMHRVDADTSSKRKRCGQEEALARSAAMLERILTLRGSSGSERAQRIEGSEPEQRPRLCKCIVCRCTCIHLLDECVGVHAQVEGLDKSQSCNSCSEP